MSIYGRDPIYDAAEDKMVEVGNPEEAMLRDPTRYFASKQAYESAQERERQRVAAIEQARQEAEAAAAKAQAEADAKAQADAEAEAAARKGRR